jgi:glycosyltransferase involved in cell wall biosynthesis
LNTNSSVGLVIPAYEPDIQALEQYITDIKSDIDPEIIRIEFDTPSKDVLNRLDNTVDQINAVDRRRGKGAAVMSGFDSLETDIIAFADADGSVPASSLKKVIRQVKTGAADVSIGSRRHPSSEIISHQTILRRFLGDGFAFIARRMLPTQCYDYQCGAKAVRGDAWKTIGNHCYEPGFAWDLEFISVSGSLGYNIIEVPVRWKDHPDSTVSPLSVSIELGTALIDIKRRVEAIKSSPRYHDVQVTSQSRLLGIKQDED